MLLEDSSSSSRWRSKRSGGRGGTLSLLVPARSQAALRPTVNCSNSTNTSPSPSSSSWLDLLWSSSRNKPSWLSFPNLCQMICTYLYYRRRVIQSLWISTHPVLDIVLKQNEIFQNCTQQCVVTAAVELSLSIAL